MRVSMTMPNRSNAENFNLIYDGCVDATRTNVPKITEILKDAVKMYKEKQIYELTGMEFLDFVNFNEKQFNLSIREVTFLHIDL